MMLGIDEAEIVFAGDAMMHQGQIDAARRSDGSYDFTGYFDAVDGFVMSADYAVVNLETPTSKPPYSGYPCFNAPDSYIDALSTAGFDLFLTANNHTLDRHDKGLVATIDQLESRRLDQIGTYKNDSARAARLPLIKNLNNIKVAFLNYTYGTNGITPRGDVVVDYIDRNLIKADVEKAKEAGAEFVIACIHWGVEYKLLPHPSQTSLADYLFDIGVDAIIGGHPHVVQPMKLVDGPQPRLLVYSLGNFISNMKTTDTRGGAMFKLTLRRDEEGKVKIADTAYRLVFTEPANNGSNYRLEWADRSKDPRAAAFAKSARAMFSKHNAGVAEQRPKTASTANSESK